MKSRTIRLVNFIGLPAMLAIFLLVSLFIYRGARQATIREFNRQQMLVAMAAADHLRDYLSWVVAEIELSVAYHLPEGQQPTEEDLSMIFHHLHNTPGDVVFIDAEGTIREMHPRIESVIGLDMREQKTFQEVRRTLVSRVSPLYRTSQGGHAFYINTPLLRNGEFAGIVGALFPIQPIIAQFVAPVRSGRLGISWVADQNGTVIFSPRGEEIGVSLRETLAREGRREELAFLEETLAGKAGIRAVTAAGGVTHVAYHPVRLGPTESSGFWGLVVTAPQSEILGSIRWLYRALGFLFLLTIAVTVGGAVLAFRHQREVNIKLAGINESLRRFSRAVDAVKEGVVMTDLEGRVVFANQAVEALFERKPSETGGICVRDLLSAEASPAVADQIMDLTRSGGFSGEVWYQTASGKHYPAYLSSRVVHDEREKPYLAIFIFLDIRDIKRAEEEINRRRLELESHLYTISHDLKTPLVTLRGYVDILLGKTQGGKMGREEMEILERVKQSAIRMNILIEHILELSRSGLVIDQSKKIPLLEAVAGAEVSLKPLLEKGSVRYTRPQEFPSLYADSQRMMQVFENLLSNALKYTIGVRQEAAVEVGWEEMGEGYLFHVRDNGPGIPPSFQTRVFEPFFRMKDQEVEGTGIGLAIVKRIIEQHGGRIWVESAPGSGAKFLFTLPRIPPPRLSRQTPG